MSTKLSLDSPTCSSNTNTMQTMPKSCKFNQEKTSYSSSSNWDRNELSTYNSPLSSTPSVQQKALLKTTPLICAKMMSKKSTRKLSEMSLWLLQHNIQECGDILSHGGFEMVSDFTNIDPLFLSPTLRAAGVAFTPYRSKIKNAIMASRQQGAFRQSPIRARIMDANPFPNQVAMKKNMPNREDKGISVVENCSNFENHVATKTTDHNNINERFPKSIFDWLQQKKLSHYTHRVFQLGLCDLEDWANCSSTDMEIRLDKIGVYKIGHRCRFIAAKRQLRAEILKKYTMDHHQGRTGAFLSKVSSFLLASKDFQIKRMENLTYTMPQLLKTINGTELPNEEVIKREKERQEQEVIMETNNSLRSCSISENDSPSKECHQSCENSSFSKIFAQNLDQHKQCIVNISMIQEPLTDTFQTGQELGPKNIQNDQEHLDTSPPFVPCIKNEDNKTLEVVIAQDGDQGQKNHETIPPIPLPGTLEQQIDDHVGMMSSGNIDNLQCPSPQYQTFYEREASLNDRITYLVTPPENFKMSLNWQKTRNYKHENNKVVRESDVFDDSHGILSKIDHSPIKLYPCPTQYSIVTNRSIYPMLEKDVSCRESVENYDAQPTMEIDSFYLDNRENVGEQLDKPSSGYRQNILEIGQIDERHKQTHSATTISLNESLTGSMIMSNQERALILVNLAQRFSNCGGISESHEHISHALRLAPDCSQLRYSIGCLLLKQATEIPHSQLSKSLLEMAKGHLEKVVDLAEDHLEIELFHELGQCEFLLGNLESSIGWWNIALRLDPNDPVSKFNMAQCYLKLANTHYGRKQDAINEAKSLKIALSYLRELQEYHSQDNKLLSLKRQVTTLLNQLSMNSNK